LNILAPSRILTAFAIGIVLGVALPADPARGAPDQKAKSPSTAAKDKASASKAPAAKDEDPATKATGNGTTPRPSNATPTVDASSPDLAAVKEAITLARKGELAQASDVQNRIADPVARKVLEWAILRTDNNEIDFRRYVAFISHNQSWPSIGLLRRRAEAALWKERLDPQTVRAYFGKDQPLTAMGKFALARALLLQGDRAGAQNLIREAWRYESFSGDLEAQVLDAFKELITSSDHKARMDMRLYVEDADGAMRSADRAGDNALVIADARIAVIKKAANAKAQLDAVPAGARRDIGYIFSRSQWLRRDEKTAEAAELILSVPTDPTQALDRDQWWIERRLVSRKLLDLGDPRTAYRVASAAALPSAENYRAEQQFTSGWIALRFLNDPSIALVHFAKVSQGTSNPITLARASYWQGRAAEALGKINDARAHYETAARYSTAYYGQIARARLGLKDMVLRPPPDPASDGRDNPTRLEIVRAIEILYAIGERGFVAGGVGELGEQSPDATTLAAVGQVSARYNDARAMVLLGKAALGRGLPLEHFAFPVLGIPEYQAIGPQVEPAVVYSIIRQESTFNPRAISSARAMGLMQVTPAAGRYVANKFGAKYDEKRLLDDQSYNVQLGAAELGNLIKDYRGSYILSFAGYNAGRGRVKDWIARYGDPRDPKVDPIDWIERIPFSETRNYIQRVLENLQVYRVRFGGSSKLQIDADLRRGANSN
jgi:soluble lytic murein transglycosylase